MGRLSHGRMLPFSGAFLSITLRSRDAYPDGTPGRWAGREVVLTDYYWISSIVLMRPINIWADRLSIFETIDGVRLKIAS